MPQKSDVRSRHQRTEAKNGVSNPCDAIYARLSIEVERGGVASKSGNKSISNTVPIG